MLLWFFFCNSTYTHLSSIRRTQIWNIVEKPQVTIEHFLAPPLKKQYHNEKRKKNWADIFQIGSKWEWKISIVNWFYLKNTRMKAWQKIFENKSLGVCGICIIAYSVRRTIYCIKYTHIFNEIFIYIIFFGTMNAHTHPPKQYQFILFHWCLYWLTILRQNNKWVSLWKRDRKKIKKNYHEAICAYFIYFTWQNHHSACFLL